uniref:Uncharacterized protein n=1 Tax=Myoviridae sp. ctqfO1 TaxID=2827710 RepID=A0A8S5T3L0_9CAUD|nr:MAG TPA: hypothetical protein [Myoviridae sp. ctqfO1]
MEFETKCLETLDKIMAEIEELSSMSPEDDAEAESITGMIDSRKKWFATVCDAYITQEVSYNAKELLRIYTGYRVEDGANIMKHIVTNKDIFENCCNYALDRICKDVKDAGESFSMFQQVTDALQKYKGHRAPISGYIVDLIKKYSKSNYVGTEPVNLKLIENSIEFIENQQNRLYDILKKYEQGKELTTAEYVTLQECNPFWGYAT